MKKVEVNDLIKTTSQQRIGIAVLQAKTRTQSSVFLLNPERSL